MSVDLCSVYLAMLFLYIMKCILVFWEYRVCASEPLISWGIQYGRMADGWADMIQYKYARADAVMDNRMQWSNKNTMVDNMHKHAHACTNMHKHAQRIIIDDILNSIFQGVCVIPHPNFFLYRRLPFAAPIFPSHFNPSHFNPHFLFPLFFLFLAS